MAEFTQDGKPMRLTTPLGTDVLVIERFECVEAVSHAVRVDAGLCCPRRPRSIRPKLLLRKPVTVSVDLAAGGQRVFHGMVRRIVQLGRSEGVVSYRAEVVPSLWFLSRRRH